MRQFRASKLIYCGMFFYGMLSASQERVLRDPFNLPHRSVRKKANEAIKLLGIVRSADKFGAVLKLNGNVETVFPNDKFFEFKVLAIKPDRVDLIKGKTRKRLFIE